VKRREFVKALAASPLLGMAWLWKEKVETNTLAFPLSGKLSVDGLGAIYACVTIDEATDRRYEWYRSFDGELWTKID